MQEILCLRCAYNILYTELTINHTVTRSTKELKMNYVCIQRKLQNDNTQLLKHILTENALINTTVLLFRLLYFYVKILLKTQFVKRTSFTLAARILHYNMKCFDNVLHSNKF